MDWGNGDRTIKQAVVRVAWKILVCVHIDLRRAPARSQALLQSLTLFLSITQHDWLQAAVVAQQQELRTGPRYACKTEFAKRRTKLMLHHSMHLTFLP